MRALMVVKVEVVFQRPEQLRSAGEVAGIDEFVLQRSPQALDEYVVEGTAAAIHADRDAALFERRQKIGGGKLRTLIVIPDLGLAEAERGLLSGKTKADLHRVGKLPTEHEATEPVHDGNQIKEPALHRNVGNIGAPDLIGANDRHIAQQVRIDPLNGGTRTVTKCASTLLYDWKTSLMAEILVRFDTAVLNDQRLMFFDGTRNCELVAFAVRSKLTGPELDKTGINFAI
jgi:hypothetical protein